MLTVVVTAATLLSPSAFAAQNLLVFGDSLSAGYGLDNGRGWVSLFEQRLKSVQAPYTVVNASISGETTAGGVTRLPDALNLYKPAIVLIELGANDGLRGQPPQAMSANLEKMIEQCRAAGARPLLFEMRIPNNYGPVYNQRFSQVFHDVASAKKITLVPFFLSPLAGDPAHWVQDDGLHPNAEAQPLLLDAIWPTVAAQLGLHGGHPAASVPSHHP
jgi:acyl-CoA thioesterase-1